MLGYDFVTVYDNGTTSGEVLGFFSGDILPNPIFTSSKQVLVTWSSDVGLNRLGWTISYATGKISLVLERIEFLELKKCQNSQLSVAL